VDELVFKIIPDPATRVAAFEKGDVDAIYHNALPFAEARRLAALPGVTMVTTDQRGSAHLGIFNVREKPLSDVKVRQAIVMAIDRGFILKNIDDGFGIPMVGPVPPASQLYDKNLKDYPFDQAKAGEMLDQAGYPKGADGTRFGFDFVLPANIPGEGKIAEVVKTNLAAVGIKVNLVPLERAAMNQKAYTDLQFGMLIDSYGLGPDPAIGVERLYNSNNIKSPPVPFSNSAGYRNAELDKLFDQEKLQSDPAKRQEIYNKIQEMIWADVPTVPLMAYVAPNIFRSSYVTGLYQGAYGNQESYEDAQVVGTPGAPAAAAKPAAPAEKPAAPAAAAAPDKPAAVAEKPAAPAAAQVPAPAAAQSSGVSPLVWVGAIVLIAIIAGLFFMRRRT
jgi:peptide/nickel transport system substrate-binding protein